jgi:hypothetical protein
MIRHYQHHDDLRHHKRKQFALYWANHIPQPILQLQGTRLNTEQVGVHCSATEACTM